MIECTFELLYPSRERDKDPGLLVVNRLYFDPGIQKGESLEINDWEVDNQHYTFNVIVVNRKWEIHPPHRHLHTVHGYPEETTRDGILMLRIFVEAEDRDKLIEITETIERLNPE